VGKNNTGWTQGPGGPKRDSAKGIASDRHGGLYAVGEFEESILIGGGRLHSLGQTDGFLVRYDRKGAPLWARAIGGEGRDELYDVAVDSGGNAFLIGTINGPVDVDRDGTIDVTAGPEGTAVIASFDPDGNLRWTSQPRGAARISGQAIAVGLDDAIYIAGYYAGGAPVFDGSARETLPVVQRATSPPADPSQMDINAYYAKLDADGAALWIKAVSGPAIQNAASLAIAGNGDLLVLGAYTASADFDADGVADLEFRSMGDRKWKHHVDGNIFLLRVTPAGEQVWVRRYTAAASHVAANGSLIAMSGSYSEDFDLDDDGVVERASDGDDWLEGFTAVLDEQGRLQQVFTVVGMDGDVVNAAGFAPDGSTLYTTGYTRQGADFDGDGQVESSSICHHLGDIFLAVFTLDAHDKK
jgi:hypothetical protein